jgi:hypothetical protein
MTRCAGVCQVQTEKDLKTQEGARRNYPLQERVWPRELGGEVVAHA